MNKYFNTYEDAWKFVHELATKGYDMDKQAEACEAFRMMYEAALKADGNKELLEEIKNDFKTINHRVE